MNEEFGKYYVQVVDVDNHTHAEAGKAWRLDDLGHVRQHGTAA